MKAWAIGVSWGYFYPQPNAPVSWRRHQNGETLHGVHAPSVQRAHSRQVFFRASLSQRENEARRSITTAMRVYQEQGEKKGNIKGTKEEYKVLSMGFPLVVRLTGTTAGRSVRLVRNRAVQA